MDFETFVRATLEANLPDIKDEVKETIAENIINHKPSNTEPLMLNDLQDIRIMGYTAADLLIVAERLRAGGVDLMKIKNYTDGFIDGYERANEDFKKAMKKCVDNIISGDLVDKECNQGL